MPRSSPTSSSPTRSYAGSTSTSRTPRRASAGQLRRPPARAESAHDAGLLEARDVVERIAGLEQHRLAVLAEHGRAGAGAHRRLREPDRVTGRPVAAQLAIVELPHHVERLDLRIVVELGPIVDRPARH